MFKWENYFKKRKILEFTLDIKGNVEMKKREGDFIIL
jgi:hypothetical protein